MNITCSEKYGSDKPEITVALLRGNLTNSSPDARQFHVYKINMEHTAQHLSTRRFKQDILEK